MSHLFSLDAQRAGIEAHARAEADGLGITLTLNGTARPAKSVNDAIRQARQYMGEFLLPAQKGDVPWGLRVTVSGGVAAYGEWPLAPGGGGGDPTFQNSPLVRIRNRWHDSGPLSALANAIDIVRAYASGSSRAAA
jgi:hypothetical protein